jgi:hypothetical protein
LAALLVSAVSPVRLVALNWWQAPGTAPQGANYSIAALSDYAYYIDLYKNGAWAGSEDSWSSPYGWDYGCCYTVENPYGCVISRTFNDNSAGQITYEAVDDYGNTITHIVTITGASDPVAQVTVDGKASGAFVLRPTGGSVALTVRFKASDADGDLRSIRPNKWNATTNQLDNNSGTFVTVSGASAGVVRTYTINIDGNYYFWSEARDARLHANGTHVTSGAYQNGFFLKVRDASKPEMNLDTHSPSAINGQPFTGNGWAADWTHGQVNRVEIWLGGHYYGNATVGESRPDVVATHGFPALTNAGFSFSITPAGLPLGSTVLRLRAVGQGGPATEISQTITVKPAGKDALIRDLNSWPAEGIAEDHYGYGLGMQYPSHRNMWGGWWAWTTHFAQDSDVGGHLFNLVQNPDGDLSYTYTLATGSLWRGDELAIYVKDPVTRWFIDAGHYEAVYEISSCCGTYYYAGYDEWVQELHEAFDSEAAMEIRKAQIGGQYYAIHTSQSTFEWRVLHSRFWGESDTPQGSTHTGTIPFDPSLYGKEITARAWSFQGSNNAGNRIFFRTLGTNYFLNVAVNPANSITRTPAGDIHNDTPVSLAFTVTPPAGIDNYTYGLRVRKWVGGANESPETGGAWETAPVHEITTPLSDTATWSGTVQPAGGTVRKIIYRLLSWQTGSPEEVNFIDHVIDITNRAPSSAAITLTRPETGQTATAIEYGQGVNVSGNLTDADGDLKGHSLWVIAPAADGTKNTVWDCYSRPLAPDWWGDPRISENGWSGPWGNGHPSSQGNSTVSGVFTPSRTGVWQLHTNGCDTSGAWGPGDTKDLTVTKATPAGIFTPKGMGSFDRLSGSMLNAAFRNPHAPSLVGSLKNQLVDTDKDKAIKGYV